MENVCKYALNNNDELVFIDDVENGLKCNCICPFCRSKMEAKNNGDILEPHFAHYNKQKCNGYEETIAHLLCKEIICEEKKIMLPKYKSKKYENDYFSIAPLTKEEKNFNLIEEQILNFSSVEIEERNDIKSLQPDIVGVTEGGLRLWIEIFVTHKCSKEKIRIIKENHINCIEIKIPKEYLKNKNKIKDFLLTNNNEKYHNFINFPFGELIIDFQKNRIIENYCNKFDCYFSDEKKYDYAHGLVYKNLKLHGKECQIIKK